MTVEEAIEILKKMPNNAKLEILYTGYYEAYIDIDPYYDRKFDTVVFAVVEASP